MIVERVLWLADDKQSGGGSQFGRTLGTSALWQFFGCRFWGHIWRGYMLCVLLYLVDAKEASPD